MGWGNPIAMQLCYDGWATIGVFWSHQKVEVEPAELTALPRESQMGEPGAVGRLAEEGMGNSIVKKS